MSEVGEIKGKIEAAQKELISLCSGDRKFTMCIPARNDDSDVVIGYALRESQKAITQLEQDNAALHVDMENEEILRDQLATAVEALKTYGDYELWLSDVEGNEIIFMPETTATPGYKIAQATLTKIGEVKYSHCHADRDGDCDWEGCPQKRDGEPGKSGRHCPLDIGEVE